MQSSFTRFFGGVVRAYINISMKIYGLSFSLETLSLAFSHEISNKMPKVGKKP